jgi:hypothetical protein
MSKYSIVNLTSGSVIKHASLLAAKVAFQSSVSQYDDVVVLDHNGESYVRKIGGKVRPGQHYRKFTQRGTTVKAKVIGQPAAPAPAPAPALPTTREEYKAAQEKWIKANGLKVGDSVKITGKAAPYSNGWEDTWSSGNMDSEVGKIGYVEKIEFAGGIRIRTGCGRSYRYPFFILEKA